MSQDAAAGSVEPDPTSPRKWFGVGSHRTAMRGERGRGSPAL